MTDANTVSTEGWLPVQRDERSAPFFDAAAEGILLIHRCPCGAFAAPEALSCAACGDPDLEWSEARGSGRLVSWTVVDLVPPAFAAIAPYTLALVELDEGPWLYALLVAVADVELRAGLPLQVRFVRPEGSESYPVFAPTP